jgi:hypothetical protein
MATVRISNDLAERILGNARALFTKRDNALDSARPENWAPGKLLDRWLDADPNRRNTLNSMKALGWSTTTSFTNFRLMDSASNLIHTEHVPTPSIQLPHVIVNSINVREGTSPDTEMFAAEIEFFKNIKKEKRELNAEATAFIEQVRKVVRNCSTLKQALSVWPGIWELVPQEFKDKHNEVSERKTAERVKDELAIDVQSLNVGLVTAKIVNGGI